MRLAESDRGLKRVLGLGGSAALEAVHGEILVGRGQVAPKFGDGRLSANQLLANVDGFAERFFSVCRMPQVALQQSDLDKACRDKILVFGGLGAAASEPLAEFDHLAKVGNRFLEFALIAETGAEIMMRPLLILANARRGGFGRGIQGHDVQVESDIVLEDVSPLAGPHDQWQQDCHGDHRLGRAARGPNRAATSATAAAASAKGARLA